MAPWGREEIELIQVLKQKPKLASGELALGSGWSHISWFIEIRSGCTEVAKPGRGGKLSVLNRPLKPPRDISSPYCTGHLDMEMVPVVMPESEAQWESPAAIEP